MERVKPIEIFFRFNTEDSTDLDLLHSLPSPYQRSNVLSITNQVYYGKLHYYDMYNKRSSTLFEYFVDDIVLVNMFLSGMDRVIKMGETPKLLEGYFTVVKRGLHYGIEYLGNDLHLPKVSLTDILQKARLEKLEERE